MHTYSRRIAVRGAFRAFGQAAARPAHGRGPAAKVGTIRRPAPRLDRAAGASSQAEYERTAYNSAQA